MADSNQHYSKFLAFLELFYPSLYNQISAISEKSDLVEANLICSNNIQSFQAIVYSDGITKDGELIGIYAGKNSIAPYSWDWRWVFALKILFNGNIVFPIKFEQKVIALPTGNHPLTNVFFDILQEEFNEVIIDIDKYTKSKNLPIREGFINYCKSINI